MDEIGFLLTSALQQFRAVPTSPQPVAVAAWALRDLGRASYLAALPVNYPELSAALNEAIQAATLPLADAARAFMPPERVYLLMTGAAGLVLPSLPELTQDRRLYVALLISELDTAVCRQAIAERNDPLFRLISANRAMSAHTPIAPENLH